MEETRIDRLKKSLMNFAEFQRAVFPDAIACSDRMKSSISNINPTSVRYYNISITYYSSLINNNRSCFD